VRTYDRLHALALTKPGVSSAADALQDVRDLHAVMMSDRFCRYKHVTRTGGSVSIPWQEWLAEAKAWVPTLDADRAGNRALHLRRTSMTLSFWPSLLRRRKPRCWRQPPCCQKLLLE